MEITMGVFVDAGVLKDFPISIARKYSVVPLKRLGQGLLVGSAEELPRETILHLSGEVGMPICAISCQVEDIEKVFTTLYEHPKEGGEKIGQILTNQQIISPQELDLALTAQSSDPKPLGELLIDLGLISREELYASLSGQEQRNNPALMPSLFIEPKLIEVLPEAYAQLYQVLPLTIADGELVIASATTLDGPAMAELKSIAGMPVRRLPARADELVLAIEKTYHRKKHARQKELRIGELLLAEGIIDQEQLDFALKQKKGTSKKLGEVMVSLGYVSEETICQHVARQLDLEFRRFSPVEIDLTMSRFISRRFAEQHKVLPLGLDKTGQHLEVAMADPGDLQVRDILMDIVTHHGHRMRPVMVTTTNIEAGIAFTYQQKDSAVTTAPMESVYPERTQELSPTLEAPEIRKILNKILYDAVMEGASDIHIENLETSVQVRFRIDGVLEDRNTGLGKANIANLISLLKLDSGLDIAERRRSQDGVFKKRVGKDRFIDFRINVHATPFGEDSVIRILDRQKNLISLEKLGFADETLDVYRRLVANPQGLILFTGPTGSGKTTTLYSTLSFLNQGDRKIVTAEDPIEYVLKGISQYQVNEAIGNTFDDYARRFLRKDPDIILIGEIRDAKTAKACISAALTGHLVFSTMHTTDAVGVVRRLSTMDTPSASIADSLLAVISQRLARRICSHCAEPYSPDPRLLEDYYPNGIPKGLVFRHGKGCDSCRGKGYRGRTGLYEFWEVQGSTRQFISGSRTEDEIRKDAVNAGMRFLLMDALHKVKAGITTVEELSRVMPIDQIQRYAHLVQH